MSLSKTLSESIGLRKLLLEFQSTNYLYHFTRIKFIPKIMRDNKLEANGNWSADNLRLSKGDKNIDDGGVSFTRNREIPSLGMEYLGKAQGYILGLVFDRNKLKSNHRLQPFDVHGYANKMAGIDKQRKSGLRERELDEEIVLGDVNNIINLIDFIYVPIAWLGGIDYDSNVFMEKIIDVHTSLHGYGGQVGKIEFKYFDGSNFKVLTFLPETEKHGKQMHHLYKQMFEK